MNHAECSGPKRSDRHGHNSETYAVCGFIPDRALSLATASEAGYDVGPIPAIDSEPEVGIAQLAALAPVSQLDRQSFLCADGPEQRLPLIAEALAGAQELFEFELFNDGDQQG